MRIRGTRKEVEVGGGGYSDNTVMWGRKERTERREASMGEEARPTDSRLW